MLRPIQFVWRKFYAVYIGMRLYVLFAKEAIHFFLLTVRYNASSRTARDIEKMQYTILRENHVIEKGMSMRNPRKGFGRTKVSALLKKLDWYASRYGDKDVGFLAYPLGTVNAYIEYMAEEGTAIPEIEVAYLKLVDKVAPLTIEECAGVEEVSRKEIQDQCDANFKSLLMSRHSMRYFSGEPVARKTIETALGLAQRTPSACNRQGWRTHVYEGEESVRLLKWQGGCHGFEDELMQSVLVTANLKAFLSYEVHQAYVDGGLYAMNLINAFHSLGVGGIPLSCGFGCDKLKELKNFGVPENEVPILVFAFGNLPDRFKVAISTRKDVKRTNVFHSMERDS